jgi:hypothetical protein
MQGVGTYFTDSGHVGQQKYRCSPMKDGARDKTKAGDVKQQLKL